MLKLIGGASDAFDDSDADIGPTHRCGCLSIGRIGTKCFLSPLASFASTPYIDAGGEFGHVGKDGDLVVGYLNETAVYRNVLHGSVGHYGSNFANGEHAHERDVTGLKADLPVGGAHDHQAGCAFEDDLFR